MYHKNEEENHKFAISNLCFFAEHFCFLGNLGVTKRYKDKELRESPRVLPNCSRLNGPPETSVPTKFGFVRAMSEYAVLTPRQSENNTHVQITSLHIHSFTNNYMPNKKPMAFYHRFFIVLREKILISHCKR